MTFIRTASALNVVALGLVAGLVAFITFQSMSTTDPLASGDTAESAVEESRLDDIHADPLAMP